MIRRPPRSTRTDTLFPYTTLFRSRLADRGYDLLLSRVVPRDPEWLSRQVDTGRVDGMIIVGQSNQSDVLNSVARSEEHTSELQSLMRISYAVFCLKKKKKPNKHKSVILMTERNKN